MYIVDKQHKVYLKVEMTVEKFQDLCAEIEAEIRYFEDKTLEEIDIDNITLDQFSDLLRYRNVWTAIGKSPIQALPIFFYLTLKVNKIDHILFDKASIEELELLNNCVDLSKK